MQPKASTYLAENIRHLRDARGLTQAQLAKTSGVPRPTWANLESGSANPTLSVLVRVSSALQVSVEELIAPPKSSARFYKADMIPTRRRGGASLRTSVPDPMPGLLVDRMGLPPNGHLIGVPHTPGTREYLTCESGEIILTASGESHHLLPGDVVVFRGDQKHAYRNPTAKRAVGYSTVVLSPAL